MAESWDAHCNRRAYGQDGGYTDNRERTEFKSGRTIYYLRNSRPGKSHALNFEFDDRRRVEGKTEFQWFLHWYENTVRSGTVPFLFDDIAARGDGERLYTIKEPPTWTGQGKKEVSMTLEEA